MCNIIHVNCANCTLPQRTYSFEGFSVLQIEKEVAEVNVWYTSFKKLHKKSILMMCKFTVYNQRRM